MHRLAAELTQRRRDALYRTRHTVYTAQGPELIVDGQPRLAFCSNDYLGLANDPRLVTALQQGAADYGVGAAAAHLVSGHMQPHQALEQALAQLVNRPHALLFSTGYMANLGVITALLGRADEIWQDRLNHASLIDGGLLAGAKFRRYPHHNTAKLAQHLTKPAQGRRIIATDGVFSMDGDLAPLPELARIATAADAWLMVDDAHGLGVLGPHGGGIVEHFGLNTTQVPILIGTLGKALGVFGAFVAGEYTLIETLIQRARSFIYTTALPPALAVATLEALRIVQSEPWRRDQLAARITQFRTGAAALGLPLTPAITPIQPLLTGSSSKALAWSEFLATQGIMVSAIRPPTVPAGTARLRITISAAHSAAHIQQLLDALAKLPQ